MVQLGETATERSARYRGETERAVVAALRAEFKHRIAELRMVILKWEARLAELDG